MIMLGLGVVYVANDDEYSYIITLLMKSLYECVILCMLEVFYSNFEYVLASYGEMWVCVVYSP